MIQPSPKILASEEKATTFRVFKIQPTDVDTL